MTEPEAPPAPTRPGLRWGRWIFVGVLILLIAGSYYFGLGDYLWRTMKDNLATWQQQTEEHLLLALLLFFVVYVLIVAFSLPIAVPLSLLSGALFGRWLGTGVVSVASTTGATLAFLSSRYLFREWVRRRFGERLAAIERGVARDGAFYLFTLRLMPVVPFFLVNLGMGLTPMRASTFAAVSWVGMLLGTFLYVSFGRQLGELESPAGLVSWQIIGSLALLGVVPLAIRKAYQWWRPAREEAGR